MTTPVSRPEADIVRKLRSEFHAHGLSTEPELCLSVQGNVRRVDLVVFCPNQILGVEVKRPEVGIGTRQVLQAMRYTRGHIVDSRYPHLRDRPLDAVLLYPGKFPLWRLDERRDLAREKVGLLRACEEHAGLTVGFGPNEIPLRELRMWCFNGVPFAA